MLRLDMFSLLVFVYDLAFLIHKQKILRSPQQFVMVEEEKIGNSRETFGQLNSTPDQIDVVNLTCIYKLPAATSFPAVNVLINEYFLRNISRSVVRVSRGGSKAGRKY